jgi:hypothetical protein
MQDYLFPFPFKRSSIGTVVWIFAFIIPFCLGILVVPLFWLIETKDSGSLLGQEALLEGIDRERSHWF